MILVVNCGSSSLKFALFDNKLNEVVKGIFERIGVSNSFSEFKINGNDDKYEQDYKTHKDALIFLFEKFKMYNINVDDIEIIGHRIVHGGNNSNNLLVDDVVLKQMELVNELAPLHNPVQMSVVNACIELFPNIKNSLSFDTAFHHSLPDYAYTYGLPVELAEKYLIRRYGFHGLSHEYILEEYAKTANKNESELNLITCHLGSGCSVCAIKNGKSVDNSMGFTPLEGLLMGTRVGDLDASVPLFIARKENLTLDQVDNLLNKKSGLVGMTGMTNIDMREVLYLADYPVSNFDGSYLNEKYNFDELTLLKKRCKLAVDVFVYRVKKYIGSYYAILGRVDAIIFTAGIGERSEIIRSLIMKDLPFTDNVNIEVIKTNEEKMIAEEALKFIK